MKRRKHHSTKALQPLHWAEIGLVNQNPASATKVNDKVPDDGTFFISSGTELGHNSDTIVEPVGGSSGFSPTKKMPIGEFLSGAALVGYTLPQLHTGKSWYVDFFAWDPVSERMKRKKYMLDRCKTVGERRMMASLLITSITHRLMKGWNPFVASDSTRHLTAFDDVLKKYRDYISSMEAKGTLKHKTAYDYLSRVGTLETYISECHLHISFIYQFDRSFVTDFLDYLIMDKDVSATTRNNYRTWLSTVGTWLVERKYISKNPVEDVHMLRESEKKRDALPKTALARMREYLNNNNKHFLLACMMEYYTLIRPDELRHLKIGNISISDREVTVPAEVAKNHKERQVGLNMKVLKLMLALKTFDSPSQYYIFGEGLKPGPEMTFLNSFRYEWGKMRKALRWPSSYQFYSLKDSGIRDLANAKGVVIARDQAGHSDVAVTNRYLKKEKQVPDEVKTFDGSL